MCVDAGESDADDSSDSCYIEWTEYYDTADMAEESGVEGSSYGSADSTVYSSSASIG